MASSLLSNAFPNAAYVNGPLPPNWLEQKLYYVAETIQLLIEKIKAWFASFQEWISRPPSPRVTFFPPPAVQVPQTLVEKISNTLPKTQQAISHGVEAAIQWRGPRPAWMSPKVAEHAEAIASAARELKRNFNTWTVDNKNAVLKCAITAMIGGTLFCGLLAQRMHYQGSNSGSINGASTFIVANALALPIITLKEAASRGDRLQREALTIGLTVVETFLALECFQPELLSPAGRGLIMSASNLGMLCAAGSALRLLVLSPHSPWLYRS